MRNKMKKIGKIANCVFANVVGVFVMGCFISAACVIGGVACGK